MHSAISPPGSGESTRRPARRSTPRPVATGDSAVEERAGVALQEPLRWAVARRPNLAAL
jgi:hypothetical protein